MDYNAYMKEKMSKMLFIEIDIKKLLSQITSEEVTLENNDIYFPIKFDKVSENVQSKTSVGNLSLSWIVEGMFLTLGIDDNFKYNNDYLKVLNIIRDSEKIVKSIIAENVKKKEYVEAFSLLKGLVALNNSEEYYDKLLSVGEKLTELDKNFAEQQLLVVELAKKDYLNSAMPYYYEALALYSLEKNSEAYVALNEYVNKGGEKTSQVTTLLNILKEDIDYKKGVELLDEEPELALKKLLPILEKNSEDAILNFYIALAYRKLENYEKAIYYLNQSIAIDSSIAEVVNEMGINYACLGEYENAIKYLRKAFEATRDVEVCTNIVICYNNMGDVENAKLHLQIAEKLNKDDEIVKQLKEILYK
ncbi:tetratricopeptide repeat protein [Inconstantimicrobium mannanitabidum]|uniref:Capsular polysaccharide biosynthesis protein n=1 Tax=Inconstantimicrobium mannanitabidum TaxID=1604901 RepID=A0ACB5RAG8_9CLOT|nr:tetratricopeptide repeat protein [Clostridium sp. TW13]GKX66102.1 capsular polysaccharide biosynthesis protein [Clostridium sp. TW13]